MKVKKESEKVDLKLNIQLRLWHPVPLVHGKLMKKQEAVADFIFLTPKSLQMVT